jgi:hypothetical protein
MIFRRFTTAARQGKSTRRHEDATISPWGAEATRLDPPFMAVKRVVYTSPARPSGSSKRLFMVHGPIDFAVQSEIKAIWLMMCKRTPRRPGFSSRCRAGSADVTAREARAMSWCP